MYVCVRLGLDGFRIRGFVGRRGGFVGCGLLFGLDKRVLLVPFLLRGLGLLGVSFRNGSSERLGFPRDPTEGLGVHGGTGVVHQKVPHRRQGSVHIVSCEIVNHGTDLTHSQAAGATGSFGCGYGDFRIRHGESRGTHATRRGSGSDCKGVATH
jgi:hypothetical protein